jgi:hypothetical protein
VVSSIRDCASGGRERGIHDAVYIYVAALARVGDGGRATGSCPGNSPFAEKEEIGALYQLTV